MKTIASTILLIFAILGLFAIARQLKAGNELGEKQLKLHEIETVAQFCESHNGSIDYDRVGLDCKSQEQAQTKKYQPKAMPNTI